jgi:UPF0271 protein
MEVIYLDINCDVGEGVGNEAAIFPYISSCNIACGGHAGSEHTMKATVKLAKAHRVPIGAHPGYPDRINFGRVSKHLSPSKLKETVREQIGLLEDVCKQDGLPLNHIKPHGALYNDIAHDMELADVFLEAIAPYKSNLALYVLSGSPLEEKALSAGFTIKREAFADRNYREDGSLVPRNNKNALIKEPEAVLQHVIQMARDHQVFTIEGKYRPISADTFCIHGDTPTALQILMYLSQELPKHNYRLKP